MGGGRGERRSDGGEQQQQTDRGREWRASGTHGPGGGLTGERLYKQGDLTVGIPFRPEIANGVAK